jgi:hypothetical protein
MSNFTEAYQELYDSFAYKRKLNPEEDTIWSEADDKEFQRAYKKLLKDYGRIPLDERIATTKMDAEKEVLPIVKAIEITADIPEINEILIALKNEQGVEFVELGIEEDEMIVRVIKEDGGAISGPTSTESHIDTPEWTTPRKRRRKTIKTPVVFNGSYAPIMKSEGLTELRYTLSPWYVPDSLDAHGEWTDKDEVQQAFWKYLGQDNRDIRLQHNTDIIAGKWVEGCTWPYEMTTSVKHPEGDIEYTFPAGTPFLGIIWEPWAWDLIKEGKIRGLSIGGTAERLESDLIIEDSDYDPSGTISFAKMIKREKGKYVVYNEDGSRQFGTYGTKAEALSRLKEMEAYK